MNQVNEIKTDYARIMLDCFVPLQVQLSIPEVRDFWFSFLKEASVAPVFEASFLDAVAHRSIAGETIRNGIINHDPNLREIMGTFYSRLTREKQLVGRLVGRVWTEGNEQCPYWGRYDQPPRGGDWHKQQLADV